MTRLMQAIRTFGKDEDGQDLIEYALIAALIGLTTVSAMNSLATNIGNTFTAIGSTLDAAFS